MTLIIDLLSWVLIAVGCFFMLTGGIGLVRLPDLFSRSHAAGITDTSGAGLILIGVMFQAGFTLLTVKLIFIFVFIMFSSPTATHALVRAARHGGLKPWQRRKASAAETQTK